MSIRDRNISGGKKRDRNQSSGKTVRQNGLAGLDLRGALLVFVLLLVTYSYFYEDPGWNGNSRLDLTFAVVQEGRLTIDSYHEAPGLETGDKAFYNGHYFSDKAIGTSLLGAVFYFPLFWLEKLAHLSLGVKFIKYFLTVCVIGIPSALSGSLMYLVCAHAARSRKRALLATAAVMLGTMCMPYSMLFYGHQLAAALLFSAFALLYGIKNRPGRLSPALLVLLGFLLGLALITEYTSLVIVLPLVGYFLALVWRREAARRAASLILPALGAVIPLALLIGYNWACFGSPFSLGYSHMASEHFSTGMSRGIMGISWPRPEVLFYITFHPAQGLFWQSPILLLSLLGAGFMARGSEYRGELVVAAIAFCAYLLITSGYYMWWGGYAFGPRNLIPMLPFLALPLVFLPRRLMPLAVILAAVSVLQMHIVAASTIQVPDNVVYDMSRVGFFDYSSIYSFCWQQLLAGDFASNLGHKILGLHQWVSLLPLALVDGLLAGMLLVRKREVVPSREKPSA